MADEPNKGGRPSKYDPSFCERVIAYGAAGKSVAYMAAKIGVARNTLELNWPAAHPEFAEALEQARLESQAWWEDHGQDNLTTPGFSASAWSRSMAARFPNDWRETHRNELTGANGKPLGEPAEVDLSGLSEAEVRMIASLRLNTKDGASPATH